MPETLHQIFTAGYKGHRVDELDAVASGYVIADIRWKPFSNMAEWNQAELRLRFGDRYKYVHELATLDDCSHKVTTPVNAPLGVARIVRYARLAPVVILCRCLDCSECHRRIAAELLHPNLRQCGQELPRELDWPPVHTCHARGCSVPVAPAYLMCGRHWKMVPFEIKRDVIRHYRRGQEIDKKPTRQYLMAATAAVEAVALAERNPVGKTPADGGQISLFAGNGATATVAIAREVKPQSDIGTCRGCGEPIRWKESGRGRLVPMNLNWTPHFATCPKAHEFRTRS